MQKIAKTCCCFFSKVNLVTTRKKIFKIVFEILEAKLTYKLNIYSLIC